jgi:hypothetical protein
MIEDNGVSATPTGLPQAEPVSVSGLRPGIPDALSSAIMLAAECHAWQVDKGGQPYILHPLRVMLKLDSEEMRIAAVLHDTVEDCGLELSLIRHRFGANIAEAVEALSPRKGEDYMDFIDRCGANDIACAVKMADLKDNMDLKRISIVSFQDLERVEKYRVATHRLTAKAIEARQGGNGVAGAVHESAGRQASPNEGGMTTTPSTKAGGSHG